LVQSLTYILRIEKPRTPRTPRTSLVSQPDLRLYAVRCSGPGRWLIWAPDYDPCAPAVRVVAVLEEPSYSGVAKQRGGEVIRFKPDTPKTRGQINNFDWRTELLAVARLLDHLAPDFHDPELFHVQKNALAAELRRLARWAAPRC
jgi:hypothetical protein